MLAVSSICLCCCIANVVFTSCVCSCVVQPECGLLGQRPRGQDEAASGRASRQRPGARTLTYRFFLLSAINAARLSFRLEQSLAFCISLSIFFCRNSARFSMDWMCCWVGARNRADVSSAHAASCSRARVVFVPRPFWPLLPWLLVLPSPAPSSSRKGGSSRLEPARGRNSAPPFTARAPLRSLCLSLPLSLSPSLCLSLPLSRSALCSASLSFSDKISARSAKQYRIPIENLSCSGFHRHSRNPHLLCLLSCVCCCPASSDHNKSL